MAILSKGHDFSSGDNVTATKLDDLVDQATFVGGSGGATDNSTLEVNDGVGGDGSLRVKDLGITTAKLADGAVSTQKIADGAITASKIAPSAASAIMPAGGLIPYAGATVPNGWLLCSGDTIGDVGSGADNESADYEDLFELIKTLYGNDGTEDWASGDTVLLPDLRGRVVAGLGDNLIDVFAIVNGAVTSNANVAVDGNVGTIEVGMAVSGSGIGAGVTVQTVTDQNNIVLSSAVTLANNVRLTFTRTDVLGDTGGAKTHTLTEAEMPSHSHGYNDNENASEQAQGGSGAKTGNRTVQTGSTGGDQAHNNVQPTIILNYIIKY